MHNLFITEAQATQKSHAIAFKKFGEISIRCKREIKWANSSTWKVKKSSLQNFRWAVNQSCGKSKSFLLVVHHYHLRSRLFTEKVGGCLRKHMSFLCTRAVRACADTVPASLMKKPLANLAFVCCFIKELVGCNAAIDMHFWNICQNKLSTSVIRTDKLRSQVRTKTSKTSSIQLSG